MQLMRRLTLVDGELVVDFPVIDAGRNFGGVCGRWYPVVLELHRLFVAISRTAVDHDDGGGRPRVWRRLRVQDHSGRYHARRVHQGDEAYVLLQDRTGVAWGHLGHSQALVSRLCMIFNLLSGLARVCGVDIDTSCSIPSNKNNNTNLGRLRFDRRGASTPLWRVESCSLHGRQPYPIPAVRPMSS